MTQRAIWSNPAIATSRGAAFCVSLMLLPALVFGATHSADPEAANGEVLATVNGKPITSAEVHAQAATQFAQQQRQFEIARHDLLEKQLQEAIRDRVLSLEAIARDLSQEQLLAEIKTPEVTEADVDRLYEENKARIQRPKAEIASSIKDYLREQRRSQAEQAYFDSLTQKFSVVTLLAPLRILVADDGPSRGADSAPVTLIEFADFKCPFCVKFLPTLQQMEKKYGDKVRVVFRQFPLDGHPQAPKAAEASLCANDQDRFWELHDAMFGNQADLSVASLKSLAAELGIKSKAFNKCLDSGKYAAQVQADRNAGIAAGVEGTPVLFINGRFLSGAVELDQLIKVIDDELRRIGD